MAKSTINKPEIETLSYHSSLCKCPDCKRGHKPAQEAKEKTTLDIEPKTKVENKESVCKKCQVLNCSCRVVILKEFEQPNQELMLIQTIQGLMACVNDNFDKLCVLGSDTSERKTLIAKALEDIDIFEKTTLFDLQKEYE